MPPEKRYPIPAGSYRCEEEIERSRFIVTVAPADSPEEAQRFVAGIKAEFPDANHNCWAYLIGPPGSSDRIGMSDDGEPHGTAGRPMLSALTHGGVGDIAVVVTRYFGGIKLGKGGMVRAYTGTVQRAIESLPRAERIEWRALSVTLDYPLLSAFEHLLQDFEAEIEQKDYSDRIACRLKLPEEQLASFVERVTEATAGKAEIEITP